VAERTPVLEVENVRRAFGGVRAVDGVSFALERGEIRALIGPNGAGKSTFFNILTGQLRADEGEVRWRGRPIVGLPPHAIWRLGISRTFQITATLRSRSRPPSRRSPSSRTCRWRGCRTRAGAGRC